MHHPIHHFIVYSGVHGAVLWMPYLLVFICINDLFHYHMCIYADDADLSLNV